MVAWVLICTQPMTPQMLACLVQVLHYLEEDGLQAGFKDKDNFAESMFQHLQLGHETVTLSAVATLLAILCDGTFEEKLSGLRRLCRNDFHLVNPLSADWSESTPSTNGCGPQVT